MKYGARNNIVGRVTAIKKGSLMCQVDVGVKGPIDLSSVMTLESLKGLGLKKGDTALRTFVNDVLEASYADGTWKKAFDATVGKSGTAAPTPPAVNRY